MAALVLRDDFESRSGGESKHRDERIPESNTIYIVIARLAHKFSRDLVAPKKRFKNGRFDVFAWFDFLGRPSPPALRRRLDIFPNEPAAKPARNNFLNTRPSRAL